MMRKCSIRPVTPREHLAVERLGAEGWTKVMEGNPACFDGRRAALVEKAGHVRWVLKEQVNVQDH